MKLERTTHSVGSSVSQVELCYLVDKNWDDFGFKTLFEAVLFDRHGIRYDLGYVRILSKGLTYGPVNFGNKVDELGSRFCSLGSSVEYYQRLSECPLDSRIEFLQAMRDVVFDAQILALFENETGFQKSLLRDVSIRDVRTSFPRALRGDAELTPYNFSFSFANDDKSGGELRFAVEPQSRPPSNIHVLIGRNGVGKTRLLAGMADSLTDNRAASIGLVGKMIFDDDDASGTSGGFLNLVIVSYSVFDRFDPIAASGERTDASIPHYYIGVKSATQSTDGDEVVRLKSPSEVRDEFSEAIGKVIGDPNKRARLESAFGVLESDPMIADMNLRKVLSDGSSFLSAAILEIFDRLSSGHKVVLLTIVRLVELVSDRSLVLIDEPETHLHPPLLASFTRAVSNLLQSRNGVAVIATHSPVLLQEVPSNCVQVIARSGGATSIMRPETETFGENVGTLTRKIFELEVENSGFYRMLVDASAGRSFDEVLSLFDNKVGGEGRAIVRASALRASREEPPASQ